MSKISLKIIAGKYKNKRLNLPSKITTRSTKSIIKESLFNTLQFDLIGKNFVEVFGGSGSIGLEALSRGAKKAYFFEKDKNAFEVLKANCKSIAPSNDFVCIYGDSFVEFPKFLKNFNEKAFFYLDPPFDIRDGMEDIYNNTIDLILKIPKTNTHLIIVEHKSGLILPQEISIYKKIKSKKFGKTTLTYYL